MIAETGLYALLLALMVSLCQSVVPHWGASRQNARLMTFGSSAAVAQALLVAVSFFCLVYSFAVSDFSVEVVAANSHTSKPFVYKISATWGHHEGSMLLWVLVLAIFGAAVAVFGRNLPAPLKARVLAIQGLIGGAFLAFLIFTSNPFARLPFPPAQGMGFNPILQDPGLAIHPPMLYLGYVGFSIAYSFSIAALIEGKVDAAWARWVRPWVLAAWSFLTAGITLGSLWAYYELGWGGWWFWDPVENASFMPWLVGTALLHCALVVERRHTLVNWTLLLSILTFTLSLIGTFLVRSGVLTSVHSFAVDPARGVFILMMIVAASGGGLLLFALRANVIEKGPPFAFISREGSLLANNILLLSAAGTVFLGTFYPLVIDAMGHDKISVGPAYFNRTFAPIMSILVAIMVFGPLLRWRSDNAGKAARPLRWTAIAAIACGLVIAFYGKNLAAGGGMALAIWLVLGLAQWLYLKLDVDKRSVQRSLAKAKAFPLSTWGFLVGHLGLAIAVVGITGMSAWETEAVKRLDLNQSIQLGEYDLEFVDLDRFTAQNYEAERVTFDVTRNGRNMGQISSERRYYPERDMVTTEAGVRPGLFSNLFVAANTLENSPGYSVRVSKHPFVLWIWGGGFMISFAGFISLADRRLRVGAPHRATARFVAAPTS